MILPAWAKYLAILSVAAITYGKGYSDGTRSEREKWLVKEAEAVAATAKREAAMQSQVDAAGLALSMSEVELERVKNEARVTTRNYYVTNPAANVACLTPERVRHVQESDASSGKDSEAAR